MSETEPSISVEECCARLCEELARGEAKKANENRGKRKKWLIRRRAFLDAADSIRAAKGSVSMTTLSQALATIIAHTMPTSNPEVADAIRRLTATTAPTPDKPDDPPRPDTTRDKAPGEVFDLSRWKLNLPVQLNGDKTGYSPTVWNGLTPDLKTFKMKDVWEVTGDGQVLVTCPIDGITTSSGTKYARTELRGTWPKSESAAGKEPYDFNFLPSTGWHRLEADFAVDQFATLAANGKPGRVCIGQIHGPNDELCRFYVDPSDPNGAFYYVNDKSVANGASSPKEQTIYLRGPNGEKPFYTKGQYLSRVIEVKDAVLTVYVTYQGVVYSAVEPLSPFWMKSSAWCYFKDGVYVAQHDRDVDGGVRGSGVVKVLFRSLGMVLHANGQYKKA